MRVAIRADASNQIGSGHVMRCATLAGALMQLGAEVAFVCRELDGHYCAWLEAQGITVLRLPAPAPADGTDTRLAHARWLGVTQIRDSVETRQALAGVDWDWLIVDHYALDAEWEAVMRPLTKFILVIDDLADRDHDADVLLDQNLVIGMRHRYVGKMPPGATLLLGPRFALLQPAYAKLRRRAHARKGPVRRILISFGGADQHNLTGRTLAAILCLLRADVVVDVIVADGSPNMNDIRSLAAGHDNVRLHRTMPTLAPFMLDADLAIGAGGATTWERLCLGLPTLVITQAANQVVIASTLARLGLIRLLGHGGDVTDSDISATVRQVLSADLEEHWSERCLAVVDGRGVARVGGLFRADDAVRSLRVRSVSLDDEALLLSWANDRTTRLNGFDARPISWDIHHKWFRRRVSGHVQCRVYIAETGDETPVGQVRFERGTGAWEIHYALGPLFRGKGLGRRMLELAMCRFKGDIGDGRVVGRVRKDNLPSRRVFERLGFLVDRNPDAADFIRFERSL